MIQVAGDPFAEAVLRVRVYYEDTDASAVA